MVKKQGKVKEISVTKESKEVLDGNKEPITIKRVKDSWDKEEIKQKGLDFLKWLALDHNHQFPTYKQAWEFWVEQNL